MAAGPDGGEQQPEGAGRRGGRVPAEQRQVIQCPCHDGRFNPLNGNVIPGPPPAPLAEDRLQVEGDAVYVQPGGGA
jgi:Rieske Fe-S protein